MNYACKMRDDKNHNQFANEQDDFLNLNEDESPSILDISSFDNSTVTQYENTNLEPGLDGSKRFCIYCKKQFSHQGSYGRHLDSKKGDKLHPLEEINRIRSKVVRRGNTQVSPKHFKSKSKISIQHEIESKEKNKIRRKLRDRQIKSKLISNDWFLNQFGKYEEYENDSFAKLVSLHLPIAKFPRKFPTAETFNLLISELKNSHSIKYSNDLINKAKSSYRDWISLTDLEKENLWLLEFRTSLNKTLGKLTLGQLSNIKKLLLEKEFYKFKEICNKDDLLGYINDFKDETNIDIDYNNDEVNRLSQEENDPNEFINSLKGNI